MREDCFLSVCVHIHSNTVSSTWTTGVDSKGICAFEAFRLKVCFLTWKDVFFQAKKSVKILMKMGLMELNVRISLIRSGKLGMTVMENLPRYSQLISSHRDLYSGQVL